MKRWASGHPRTYIARKEEGKCAAELEKEGAAAYVWVGEKLISAQRKGPLR